MKSRDFWRRPSFAHARQNLFYRVNYFQPPLLAVHRVKLWTLPHNYSQIGPASKLDLFFNTHKTAPKMSFRKTDSVVFLTRPLPPRWVFPYGAYSLHPCKHTSVGGSLRVKATSFSLRDGGRIQLQR